MRLPISHKRGKESLSKSIRKLRKPTPGCSVCVFCRKIKDHVVLRIDLRMSHQAAQVHVQIVQHIWKAD